MINRDAQVLFQVAVAGSVAEGSRQTANKGQQLIMWFGEPLCPHRIGDCAACLRRCLSSTY